MSTIISLYGGPGCGKSTLAADGFVDLKRRGYEVELVQEFIKDWAWEEHKPNIYDQVFIFGQQAHKITKLLGKCDFIITDSGFFLSPFYEWYYNKTKLTDKSAIRLYELIKENGHQQANFFLKRTVEYNPKGRYQTLEELSQVDQEMFKYLEPRINISIIGKDYKFLQ